jgi:hypothetical protein
MGQAALVGQVDVSQDRSIFTDLFEDLDGGTNPGAEKLFAGEPLRRGALGVGVIVGSLHCRKLKGPRVGPKDPSRLHRAPSCGTPHRPQARRQLGLLRRRGWYKVLIHEVSKPVLVGLSELLPRRLHSLTFPNPCEEEHQLLPMMVVDESLLAHVVVVVPGGDRPPLKKDHFQRANS